MCVCKKAISEKELSPLARIVQVSYRSLCEPGFNKALIPGSIPNLPVFLQIVVAPATSLPLCDFSLNKVCLLL